MKTVQQFIESYQKKNTRHTYGAALRIYFKTIGTSDTEYFSNGRNYEEDIEKFFLNMMNANKPPKTVVTYLGAVKTYLLDNDIELSQRVWKKISRRVKVDARTVDEVPREPTIIRKIIAYMDIKGKALFLVLVSSGMRIGEGVTFRLEDMKLDKDPAEIIIRGENTKSGSTRIAFISSEAKEALEEYLRQRDKWLIGANNRSKTVGNSNQVVGETRVFPITTKVAIGIWNNALKNTGLTKRDPSTNRRTLHPHILRKYFRTRLGRINRDMAEVLMGHSGYLTKSYRRYDSEELAEWYKANEHLLLVFTDTTEITKLKESVDKSLENTHKLLESALIDNANLKVLYNSLSAKVDRYMEAVDEEAIKKGYELTSENIKDKVDWERAKEQAAVKANSIKKIFS